MTEYEVSTMMFLLILLTHSMMTSWSYGCSLAMCSCSLLCIHWQLGLHWLTTSQSCLLIVTNSVNCPGSPDLWQSGTLGPGTWPSGSRPSSASSPTVASLPWTSGTLQDKTGQVWSGLACLS